MTDVSVAAIAAMVGGRLIGNGELTIRGIGDLRTAGPDRIGFVRHARYAAAAMATGAGAILLAEPLETKASQIVVSDVDIAYAKVATHFHPLPHAREHSVHPSAIVHPEAELEAPVQIGACAVVGKCRIGSGTVVMPGAVILDGVKIGRSCVIYPNATLYHGVQLGDRVIAHAGVVIGSDGFGYAREGTTWLKVPQLGTVVVEDDVEFGAGTAIDRGTIGNTRIGGAHQDGQPVPRRAQLHDRHRCGVCGWRQGRWFDERRRSLRVWRQRRGGVGTSRLSRMFASAARPWCCATCSKRGTTWVSPSCRSASWMKTQHAMQDLLEMREAYLLQKRAAADQN
jgi:acetyltransferase-like isoleucine patch superfamily enzyme